jgi:hypothetical protein
MLESSLLRVPPFPDHLSHDRAGLHFRQVTYKSNPLVVGSAVGRARQNVAKEKGLFPAPSETHRRLCLRPSRKRRRPGTLTHGHNAAPKMRCSLPMAVLKAPMPRGFITFRRRSTVPGKLLHGNDYTFSFAGDHALLDVAVLLTPPCSGTRPGDA